MPAGCDGVDVSLAQQDVVDSLQLDLATVLGFEQDAVTDLDAAHVRANGDDARPGQATSDLGRRGDHDPAHAPALASLGVLAHEHPVVQQADGNRPVRPRGGVRIGDGGVESAHGVSGDARGAAQVWRRLGIPYDEGIALMFGDAGCQREALDCFTRLGAHAAAARCRERMLEQGLRIASRGPNLRTRANPSGLTARELQTLTLLGEGLTNAEIAARIRRSVKTVDHHVAAVIEKIGAANRREAVAIGRERGLVFDTQK